MQHYLQERKEAILKKIMFWKQGLAEKFPNVRKVKL